MLPTSTFPKQPKRRGGRNHNGPAKRRNKDQNGKREKRDTIPGYLQVVAAPTIGLGVTDLCRGERMGCRVLAQCLPMVIDISC